MKYFRSLYKVAYTLGVLALMTSVLLNAGIGSALAAAPEKAVEQVAYGIQVSPEDTHVCDSEEGYIHRVTITVAGPPGGEFGVKLTWNVVHPTPHQYNPDQEEFYRDQVLDGNGVWSMEYDLYWPGTAVYDPVTHGNIVETHLSAVLYIPDPANPGQWISPGMDDVDFYSYEDRCEPDPTPTPTATETPVTPTPDPIVLTLNSQQCEFIQGDNGLLWHWRVNNPNAFSVNYDVKVGGVVVLGSQTAAPGNSYFYIDKGDSGKTVVIEWINEYQNPATASAQQGWSYCMSLSDKCIDPVGNMTFTVNNWTPAEDMANGADPNNAPYDVYQNGGFVGSLSAPLGNSTFKMPSLPGSNVEIRYYNSRSSSIIQSSEVCPNPQPKVKIYDPCEVNCLWRTVISVVENIGEADAANLTWFAYFNAQTVPHATGVIDFLGAGQQTEISFPTGGPEGSYRIEVFHNGNLVSVAGCSASCTFTDTTPTPSLEDDPTPIPSPVPEDDDPLLIPVTGLDYTPTVMANTFQNLGFGLLAVGMMLHGVSLRKKDE